MHEKLLVTLYHELTFTYFHNVSFLFTVLLKYCQLAL